MLSNLGEMNKLWIRMVHTSKQERAKRDKDRNDLRVTVGENIVRISQFEGCSVEVYKEFVLDKLIAIVRRLVFFRVEMRVCGEFQNFSSNFYMA